MKKYKDYLGLMFFMIFTVAFVIGIIKLTPPPKPPTQGIPHNYWVPTKEDTDWTGTTQGEDTIYLDIDMDCGDADYYDSIPRYSRFADVPAGTDTMIIVAGILYEMNDNKTQWIPIYLDEDVMWIGDNGDTIWE